MSIIKKDRFAPFLRIKKINFACLSISLFSVSCQVQNENESQKHPNVLFISVDDLNYWKRYHAITPNLDRLLNQGVSFTNAFCASPVCMASRHAVLSGLHPVKSGWYDYLEPIKQSYDSVISQTTPLPLYFKEHGYKTMACGKIYHSGPVDFPVQKQYWDTIAPQYVVSKEFKKASYNYGSDHFYPFPKEIPIVGKFGKIEGRSLCGGPLERSEIPNGQMHDEYVADWGIGQINSPHDEPFFLALGFTRPHVPYTAPKEFFDLYNADSIQVPVIPTGEMVDIPLYGKATAYGLYPEGDHNTINQVGPGYWKLLIHSYLACVSFVDSQIGRVLDALDKSKVSGNTIIVLWSDNGQGLGEKKHWRKMSLWNESVKTPLIFRLPGADMKGRKIDAPVGLIDIYPTLLDVCHLPALAANDGKSLKQYFNEPGYFDQTPELTVWRYGNFRVSDKNWTFIRYRDGSEELYNLQSDSLEHTNLATEVLYSPEKERLKRYIPATYPLPPGMSVWKEDELDYLYKKWTSTGVPGWLR